MPRVQNPKMARTSMQQASMSRRGRTPMLMFGARDRQKLARMFDQAPRGSRNAWLAEQARQFGVSASTLRRAIAVAA